MRAAILPAVAPLLGDSTSWERRLAAVEMLAPAGPAARALLEEAAKDPSPFVRSAAVTVGAAAGSTAILVAGAADPTPAVRAAAARALARRQAADATTSGTEALPGEPGSPPGAGFPTIPRTWSGVPWRT